MAARKRQPEPLPQGPSAGKIMFLVLLCVAAGSAIVYWGSPKLRELVQGAQARGWIHAPQRPGAKTAAKAKSAADEDLKKPALPPLPTPLAAKAEAEPEKKKNAQLERENKRLRETLAARERENAELKIQLKLLQDGSRPN